MNRPAAQQTLTEMISTALPFDGSDTPFPARSFYFVRHGQTDWNAEGRFQGLTDVPLNANGRAQAASLAQALRAVPFDRIVTSPLQRARHTAEAVALVTHRPLHVEQGLTECDFGSLEGACYATVMQGAKAHQDLIDRLAPDGEQWRQVLLRARRVVGRWLLANPGETVLFVAHDAILQALSEQLCGNWFKSSHATPYHFVHGKGGWHMAEIGQ